MSKQFQKNRQSNTIHKPIKSNTGNTLSEHIAPAPASITAQTAILNQLSLTQRQRAILSINQTQGNQYAQRLITSLQATSSNVMHVPPAIRGQRLQAPGSATSTLVIQRSPLSESLAVLWDRNNKGPFFARLRSLTERERADPDTRRLVDVSAQFGDDDRWLAQTILRHGPEPQWPAVALEERHQRATEHRWAPEPGNIEATLGTTAQGRRVSAYYFPGASAERALIIGGMHGSELSAVQVAEQLLDNLRIGRGPRPFFTVIIVPRLFPDNIARAESRPQSIGSASNVGRYTRETPTRSVDPNRQFPQAGRDLNPDNPRDARNRLLEPENMMLLELIQRFQPSRVVNLHAIRTPQSAGIYADPRTNAAGVACGFDADRDLALAMAAEAERRGAHTPGNRRSANPDVNAIYPLDPAAVPPGHRQPRSNQGGISFGTWGTTEVSDAARPGANRPAMTVITVEVAGAHRVMDLPLAQQAAREAEIGGHVTALQDIFLGQPGSGARPVAPLRCPAPAATPQPTSGNIQPKGQRVRVTNNINSMRNDKSVPADWGIHSADDARQTTHLPLLQRQSGATAPGANRADPQRQLAERILGDVQMHGGITVAVYPVASVGAAAEFRRQATQFARDHGALGLAQNAAREGMAIELTDGLPSRLGALHTAIQGLLASYPDLTNNQSLPIPVQTLAIFTHGERDQLQAGAHGQWIKNSLAPWIRAISPYLTPSPQMLLYACSTAGQPARGLPFAEAMRELLQSELEQRYGQAAGVAPTVWGHTTAAHTTANKALVEFSGGAVSSAGADFLTILGRRMATLAIAESGHEGALTDDQRMQVERAGVAAIGRVFRTSSAEHGTRHPLNTYLREIPQMGIDRVWGHLSTPATPNLSDLNLTPDAVARMARGLMEFQTRFARQLANLRHRVNSMAPR